MKLKNYTTEVSAEQSIMEIEKLLGEFGADAVMKQLLSDGTVHQLSFRMRGKGYRLPANIEGVKKTIFPRGARIAWHEKSHSEQAYRTAWRIIKDWIHAQLSIIKSGQAEPDEVMLPYLWNGKESMYERYKRGLIQVEDKSEESR